MPPPVAHSPRRTAKRSQLSLESRRLAAQAGVLSQAGSMLKCTQLSTGTCAAGAAWSTVQLQD